MELTSQGRYLRQRGMQEFGTRYPNVREACENLFDNNEFNQQLRGFELIRNRFEEMITDNTGLDPQYYGAVPRLKESFARVQTLVPKSSHLPSLPRLISLARGMEKAADPKEERLASVASQMFTLIAGLIDSGHWGYVKDLRTPGNITAVLLIEGYGLMLEQYYGVSGMRHDFVIGFEELLWNEQRGLKETVMNVLPWMIEERKDFPLGIRKDLETLYRLQNGPKKDGE